MSDDPGEALWAALAEVPELSGCAGLELRSLRGRSPAELARGLSRLTAIPGTPHGRLERLSDALTEWSDPDGVSQTLARRLLPEWTGFSPGVVAEGIRCQAARWSPPAIAQAISSAHPRFVGDHPRPAAVMAAGNVPGLAALDLVLSLVAGDPVFVKLPSREPVTATMLAIAITRALGVADGTRPMLLASWPGGDPDLERPVFTWASYALVSGTDATVRALVDRWAHTGVRISPMGHRVSAAYLPRDGFDLDESAWRLAVDVAIWDQEGCLSPHVVFVDRALDARAFAERLADRLGRLATELPRGVTPLATRAAIRHRISRAETAALGTGERAVWPVDGGGAVLVERGPLIPSPLGRAVVVRQVDSPTALWESLEAWSGRLQSLGVGDDPGACLSLVHGLECLGATRLCAIGRMQEPGPGWFGEEVRASAVGVQVEHETDGRWREVVTRIGARIDGPPTD